MSANSRIEYVQLIGSVLNWLLLGSLIVQLCMEQAVSIRMHANDAL